MDNDDPEDTLIDELDPGCHTDGNAGNSGSYNANDNDETDVPACSNTGDDDGDGKIDTLDPGCHTDGNAGNSNSYNPNDNNETDVPACSNTGDDDSDGKIDAADPGCHTDGDTNNSNSYDPNDNDETDVAPPQNNGGGGGGSRSGSRRRTTGQVLGVETSCGIYTDKFLRKGYRNDVDTVKEVQQFLNDYMNAGLAVDGIYGSQTEAAVSRFQLAHADKVLVPWGISAPTGIFYLTTQTEVNNIMCPDLGLGIPAPLINWSAGAYDTPPPIPGATILALNI